MSDNEELLLDPQKQLLFAVSNTHKMLGSLSEEIETLSALVNDFGERMSSDIRERWKAKLAVSLQDCELSSSGIPDEMQRLSMAALHAIEGRFYEVVEKNYKSAGSCYEQAANVLASIPELERLITYIALPVFPVKGDDEVAKGHPKYLAPGQKDPTSGHKLNEGRVYINKTQYFEGVPPEVWDFHIGGYQVCHKWLKDRQGRKLAYDDLEHYQKTIKALAETIRLMAEIDAVIGSHGGWPLPGSAVASSASK